MATAAHDCHGDAYALSPNGHVLPYANVSITMSSLEAYN